MLLISVVLMFLSSNFLYAQNLVPNGSFEEYNQCPGSYSEAPHEFQLPHWSAATLGTPDHFHRCSAGEAGVPHNWAGVAYAYEGEGYAGIYMWMEGDNHYREYIQCKLLQPLARDSAYLVSFRYKLSSYSRYCIDRIGLLLSATAAKTNHDAVLPLAPTLSIISDSALTKQTGLWETASMKYKASGGEKFLIIGNFYDNQNTRSYKIISRPVAQEMLSNSAYYYIDDVKVIDYAPPTPLLPEFTLTETRLNTTYLLKNIQFEFNSYRLVPPSFDELDKVADYLLRHPGVTAQLFGHTDDQGSESYNLTLSRNRAKNVGAYLISAGVESNRIEFFGYGKSRPLIKSTSDQARIINRRVEVKFIQ